MSETAVSAELDISGLSDVDAINAIGDLIDAAQDTLSSTYNDKAFVLLDEIETRLLPPHLAAHAFYLRANAWENRRILQGDRRSWRWELTELQEQILSLRRAVTHVGFDQLHRVQQCQILTNLGNQLNSVGRFVEAISLWDRALRLEPKFGMALGNRGGGLAYYADALYDPGHAARMLTASYDSFKCAGDEDAFYESPHYTVARSGFEQFKNKISSRIDVEKVRKAGARRRFSLGRTPSEKRYRAWCLENRLFINPLNDLGALPIASHDVLNLPSITLDSPSAHPPAIFGYFNQMKQEFVSARHLFYEGIHSDGVHYSDRGVLLINTLDYPAYSFSIEKMRAAFRLAYSLLDKIGFFVNEYFALGLNPKRVSFRTVWYEEKGKEPRPLLARFAACENWPLRGLFWLSKDLFDEAFQDCMAPEAAALSDVRNHLEHKYLQLHHDFGFHLERRSSDEFTLRLAAGDFEAKTLHMLKLTRAALIYLSLAVHREERMRSKLNETPDGVILPLSMGSWDDDWKRRDL